MVTLWCLVLGCERFRADTDHPVREHKPLYLFKLTSPTSVSGEPEKRG